MKNQLLFKASLIFSFYLSLFIFPIGNVCASTIEFTTPPTPLDSTTLISNPEVKISTTDSSQHYVFTNVNNSLVGWWKGEGSINDESSFSNNGTLNGGATYVTGKFGQAFNFNGIDQDVSTSTSVLPQGTKVFTISLWIKPTSLGYWKGIIGKGSADNNVITIQAHVDGSIYGDVDNGSGDSYGQTSPGILSVGNWSHIVMVYNGDGSTNRDKLKLYINLSLIHI